MGEWLRFPFPAPRGYVDAEASAQRFRIPAQSLLLSDLARLQLHARYAAQWRPSPQRRAI
jgi:hypothetical protein